MAISMNIQDSNNKVATNIGGGVQPGKPVKKKKSKKRAILTFLALVAIGLIAFGVYKYRQFRLWSLQTGIDISATDVIGQITEPEPELKKDSSGTYTNALLVGKDTREYNQGLQNTDTIIIASYNHKTNEVVFISIPRDTYVEAPGGGWYCRINAVYNLAEQQKEGSGLPTLVETVEEYSGLEIQYYGLVDLQGFIKVIDLLGGVDVEVENTFTDYRYPSSRPGERYEVVSFKKGLQHMDGATALKYARSRHSMDAGEGSDFARAKRQQRVIMAVKDKLLQTQTLLNPQKIMDIANAMAENVQFSQIGIDDITAGINLFMDKNEDVKMYSFVMSPAVGYPRILTDRSGLTGRAYGIVPVAGLGKYDDIHEYISYVLKYPDIYEEDPRVLTYNIGLGYQATADETKKLQKSLPYINIVFMGTLYSSKEGVYIYSQTDEKSPTLKFLAEELADSDVILAKPDFITTRLNGEDITILFGKPVEKTDETTNEALSDTE